MEIFKFYKSRMYIVPEVSRLTNARDYPIDTSADLEDIMTNVYKVPVI